MHKLAIPMLLLLAGLPSCMPFHASGQVGYTQMAIDGNIALATAGSGLSGTVDQGFDSAFGLGDERGSPYARLQLDAGVPVITVSGFAFEETGTGQLDSQFGVIVAGTNVISDLQFTNLKGSLAFQIDLGPVAVSPGIALDYFDLEMTVRDTGGLAQENIDVLAPVPMAFLRGEASLGVVAAVAEVGFIRVPKIREIEGTFWDAEAMLEVRPLPMLHFFAGYRFLHVDGEGTVDNQDFATDLDVSGWMIGGGVRF